jgi:NitT/TauT family transport system substrate-binding protein
MSGSDRWAWSRRELLARMAAAGGTALAGLPLAPAAAEPPPETSRIRMIKVPGICTAPQYVAEELLRAEGFSEVQYVPRESAVAISPDLAAGEIDLNLHFAAPLIIQVDKGDPVVMLAGAHVGCFELIANDPVRSIRDLRGKRVAVNDFGLTQHVFLASMVAYVGMDPRKDVNFVAHPPAEAKRLLAEGKVDAYLGFPPDPQELRAKKVGHVVVNSSVDRPWSQYFCCMVAANREFVRKHPVATKRALRAILKSVNVCAVDPASVARTLVDRGFTPNLDYARDAMKSIPYGKWRDYSPLDTVRFYALRLQEAGMIKASPQKIIAQGTDWRFLNELKKELKG